MWLYADHLEVRKDFIPVFTEEADRKQPATWKFFIPHQRMREILQGLIRALERGSAKDKLSLWMHGPYGTGKTFAAFVLKHLLEDDLADVEDYFHKHQSLMDLWPRLKALREKGPYLVIYRSGSAHLTSSLKLLVELQRAIKEKLEQMGHEKLAGETLYDAILQKLSDPESAFDWPKAFARHKGTFLEFPSAEDVLTKLKNGELKQTVNLAERVMQVLEKEGFMIMDDPHAAKKWLKDVIKQNSLAGILFIWDEFTDFFVHNAATTTLQELAHASGEIPFYLFLVTHKSPETFQKIDKETRDKLLERFHNFYYEMKPVTAYQLMSNAIEIKKDGRDKWEVRKESLWNRVEKTTVSLLGDEASKKDFKGLIPLHPSSAFLLAEISRLFSSSQRTLFKFLKEEDPHSFLRFIKEYPHNNWYWLTADILWDYFFHDDNPELAERVRDIMGYYRSRVEHIKDENAKRVFKVLMLLFVLERQMGQGFPLERQKEKEFSFLPTRSTLNLLFAETPVAEELKEAIQILRSQDFIRALFAGSEEKYTIPSANLDEKKLQDIRKQFMELYSFEKIMTPTGEIGSELIKSFTLDGAEGRRQKLTVVPYKDLKFRRERVEPELEPYQIANVLVVCQDEDQVDEAESLAEQLSEKSERAAYIVVQAPFNEKKWGEWINYKANHKYCYDEKDTDNVKFYAQQTRNLVEKWLTTVKLVKHKTYYKGDEIEIVDKAGYEKYFQQLTYNIFKYGPEQLISTNTLYSTTFGKAGAEIGLGVKTTISEPYKTLVNELKDESFWDGDGFKKKPEHALSRMKQEIDELFEDNESVNLYNLWEMLQASPYGLVPSPVSITLIGYMLRDYAQGYYWSDGSNSFSLNHNKLADLIEAVMKGRRGCDEYEIRRVSPEGERFCALIRDIFDLSPDKTSYPEEARKSLRNHLTAIGYPIWALRYTLKEADPNFEAIKSVLKKIEVLLSASEGSSLNSDYLKEFVTPLVTTKASLKRLVTKDNLALGMKCFLGEQQPSLMAIIYRLNLDLPSFMSRLRLTMSEEVWLWDQGKVSSRLPELYADLELVDALNQLCAAEENHIETAITYLSVWLKKSGKLPLRILANTNDTSIRSIINDLSDLIYSQGKGFNKKLTLAQQIKAAKEDIRQTLQDQIGVLRRWIKDKLGQELAWTEAEEIYKGLPDLSQDRSLEGFMKAVQVQINTLGRRKLLTELMAKWLEMTKSESPVTWSKQHMIPIRWVLEGPAFNRLFTIVNRPETKTQNELQEALDFLEGHADELEILNNQKQINDKLVSLVAKNYKELLVKDEDVEDLKRFLYNQLGDDVFNWHERLNEVNGIVKRWVNSFYKSKALSKVLRTIDEMPEAKVKDLLKLLAENPLVGNLLLRREE